MEILMWLCWGAMNLTKIKVFPGALDAEFGSRHDGCCSLVSLATKSKWVFFFFFPHCLSSEIFLEVQQANLKFKRRSWEPARLGALGLKSFQSVRGNVFPSLAWEHSHAIFFPGPSVQKLSHSRLLVSVGQGLP